MPCQNRAALLAASELEAAELAAAELDAAELDAAELDAAELDALPPQAANARQHTHSMDAHKSARYFFMILPFPWFPPCGKVTMTQALKLRGFKTV